jgi:hypothetical protein
MLSLTYVLIVIGNLLIVLANVVLVRRTKRVSGTPSTAPDQVVLFSETNAYAGAFFARVVIAIATAVMFLRPEELGGQLMTDDPGSWPRIGLRVGLAVLPALLTTLTYSGEVYLLSEQGIKRVKGDKRTRLAWSEVTVVSHSKKDRGIIVLTGGDAEIAVPETVKGSEQFYPMAARLLPEAVRQEPTYLYVASMAASEKGRVEGR